MIENVLPEANFYQFHFRNIFESQFNLFITKIDLKSAF